MKKDSAGVGGNPGYVTGELRETADRQVLPCCIYFRGTLLWAEIKYGIIRMKTELHKQTPSIGCHGVIFGPWSSVFARIPLGAGPVRAMNEGRDYRFPRISRSFAARLLVIESTPISMKRFACPGWSTVQTATFIPRSWR